MKSNIVRDSAPSVPRSSNVRITVRTFLLRLLAACALGCIWLRPAVAAPVTQRLPTIVHGSNSATAVYDDGGLKALLNQRQYSPSGTAGVNVVDTVLMAIGGEVISAAAARTVPTAALAVAAARAVPLVSAATGGYAIGTALRDYMDDNGVHYTESGVFTRIPPVDSSTPGSGSWAYPGQAPGTGYGSPDAACQAYRALQAQPAPAYVGATQDGAYYTCYWFVPGYGNSGYTSVHKSVTCQMGQPDADGKCPYNGAPVPVQPADVPTYLTKPAVNPAGLVKQVVDAGVEVDAGATSLTGPAASPLPKVVTSTGPSGTTTSTTSNNYQYDGAKVSYTTTTTTNVTNNAGDVTSTTTTTDSKPDDERSECEVNPMALACAELDTPEGEIPKETKNVSFQEESLFGGGACPVNSTMSFGSIGGQSATVVDWSTFCNYALPVRGLVMALAAITGFFIILPGSNQA